VARVVDYKGTMRRGRRQRTCESCEQVFAAMTRYFSFRPATAGLFASNARLWIGRRLCLRLSALLRQLIAGLFKDAAELRLLLFGDPGRSISKMRTTSARARTPA